MLARFTFIVAFLSALWLVVVPSLGDVAAPAAADGPGLGTCLAIVLAIGGFLGRRLRR